jgi:hypothetical protein
MPRKIYLLVISLIVCLGCSTKKTEYTFDVKPDTTVDASIAAVKLIEQLKARKDTAHVTVVIPKGRYDFYPDTAFSREYYISNHDQSNPRKVGFALENLQNVTIDGQGSEFIFHGRMIPFAILKGQNITLKNFSIDFEIPALRQLNIVEVDPDKDELLAEIYPGGNYRIDDGKLVLLGEGFEVIPKSSMAFRPDKHLTYNRQDISFNPESVTEASPDHLCIRGWDQVKLTSPGERYVLRSWERPAPGIFIGESSNTVIENVQVHYAEGMGLLAQMSENITLDRFSVCLKENDSLRYFTTQADATHFSACKGVILSRNGLYEMMADDAINVHGTYLRVTKRINDNTIQARYMHPQAWGFKWGETGRYGIENLTWTPEVIFSDNIIRNNRARGALFSTPKRVICENNLFDHTHGTAILLCGDCNGWYETGACKEVIIRNNRFINGLTAYYQFTNAIISIYPEIPNLKDQQRFFHSGILIEKNIFETFDRPLVYAKSTDGLTIRNNSVTYNTDFEPFHWNKHPFFFERVRNVLIENNHFESGWDAERDIRTELSSKDAVSVK